MIAVTYIADMDTLQIVELPEYLVSQDFMLLCCDIFWFD